MAKDKKKNVVSDVELLIWMLQKEWICSKEPVWRVEVPAGILKACNKEIEGMTRYLRNLNINSLEVENLFSDGEELPLFRVVFATKDAYVLIRVAKKLLAASKEAVDRKKLVIVLDDEEYRLVATRFFEYL